MRRIEPYFPLSHGIARDDDRRVISGIIFVIRNGLRWRDAPKDYGPHAWRRAMQLLQNRWLDTRRGLDRHYGGIAFGPLFSPGIWWIGSRMNRSGSFVQV